MTLWPLPRQSRKTVWSCAFAIAAVFLAFISPTFGWMPVLYRYNTSPSVPIGGYYWTPKWPPEVGDIVMMRDPPHFRLNWLLKRVAGVGGDTFCWHPDENRHYVNDTPGPVIPQLAYTKHIPIWTGCRVLEADEIVGFGDHPLAYGSSYFGPVKLDQLFGVYRRW